MPSLVATTLPEALRQLEALGVKPRKVKGKFRFPKNIERQIIRLVLKRFRKQHEDFLFFLEENYDDFLEAGLPPTTIEQQMALRGISPTDNGSLEAIEGYIQLLQNHAITEFNTYFADKFDALLYLPNQQNINNIALASARQFNRNYANQYGKNFNVNTAIMENGIIESQSLRAVKSEVKDYYNKHKPKYKEIPRIEVSKSYGMLRKQYFADLDIPNYIWQTMLDERVRPSHQALQDAFRNFSQDPYPGEEWNCRCIALPPDIDNYSITDRI